MSYTKDPKKKNNYSKERGKKEEPIEVEEVDIEESMEPLFFESAGSGEPFVQTKKRRRKMSKRSMMVTALMVGLGVAVLPTLLKIMKNKR